MALYLLYRGIRNRAYFRGLGERLGFLPSTFDPTGVGSVWLHAVSVGEVLSAVELIRRVRAERPDLAVFVSTTTLAGRAMAEQKLAGLAGGVFYAPLDYVSVVRRVLRRLRPVAVVVMETEIWPHLYREAKQSGASLVVVNGRISDRALPRYLRFSWFFREALRWPDAIFAQSAADAGRYVAVGAPAERVRAAGNLKYDFQPPRELGAELAGFLDGVRARKVWVAASTMPPAVAGDPDEDDAVIAAFQQLRREGLLLILAPRRPERFDAAAEKLRAAGLPFVRRSELRAGLTLPGVLLLDSIGELAGVFARADVVFMGGTLASRGGHNILEPAYFGKPVIAGPHLENFAEMAGEFTRAGALVRIGSAGELGAAVARVLDDAGDVGERARALAESKRGVVDRIAAEVLGAADRGVPQPLRTLPQRAALRPLACGWAVGHRWNLARGQAAARGLATRVVSIGGLTMGGSGKTPVVAHLAERVENAAILTRGYGRVQQDVVIVPRGASAAVAATGDEAQLYIRRALAHVGVGADRYETGRRMEQELRPGLFLLDDGLQHVRLRRDVDIVVIDAEDAWGGGLFPLGRRREPLEALARASAIVITRVPQGARMEGIERAMRRYNAGAPVFRARMRPEPWARPERRVGAFCGIGSPRAFRGTLAELGLEVVNFVTFGDHHRYGVSELEAVARQARAAGAEVLVTTEKDRMNLPESVRLPLPIECVRIGLEIEDEAALLSIVLGEPA